MKRSRSGQSGRAGSKRSDPAVEHGEQVGHRERRADVRGVGAAGHQDAVACGCGSASSAMGNCSGMAHGDSFSEALARECVEGTPSSIRPAMASSSSAAGAPSATRWSKVSVSTQVGGDRMVPLLQHGRAAMRADAEDARLRRVEDRREGVDAEAAEVRRSSRCRPRCRRINLAGAGALGQRAHAPADFGDGRQVGAAHHRHHETAGQWSRRSRRSLRRARRIRRRR